MAVSKFNEDVKKMSEEDPLRTLTLFLKYNFPIKEAELCMIIKNAEATDYFKTHKILIEYNKEKLTKALFNKLLNKAEEKYDGSYTQMLILFEIGKQYIEQNPKINFGNDKEIQKLIKLSPISLNFLDLPQEINYTLCQSFVDSKDPELIKSLLNAKCMEEKGFKKFKKVFSESLGKIKSEEKTTKFRVSEEIEL